MVGEPIGPEKMKEWGVVNEIVPPEKCVETAVKWARKICSNSPDSVVVSRMAMLASLERTTPPSTFGLLRWARFVFSSLGAVAR